MPLSYNAIQQDPLVNSYTDIRYGANIGSLVGELGITAIRRASENVLDVDIVQTLAPALDGFGFSFNKAGSYMFEISIYGSLKFNDADALPGDGYVGFDANYINDQKIVVPNEDGRFYPVAKALNQHVVSSLFTRLFFETISVDDVISVALNQTAYSDIIVDGQISNANIVIHRLTPSA